MSDSHPVETFSYITEQLSKLGIVYLHVVDPLADGAKRISPVLRRKFDRTYIVNGGFNADSANAAIRSGETDLVAFGVPFIANPDLPQRFRIKAALAAPDQGTFYAGEEKGFTDYPVLV
jgi:N-ethylmaleimide reductase